MHVHGSGESKGAPADDDPLLIDLDLLAADENQGNKANVA
jgi:hypothetical protein